MTDEEARVLEARLEKEMLKALTARQAADALNEQLKESLRSVRKFIRGVDSASREIRFYGG